ncbi:MAG TPA: zinc-binding alcohol dehydrogenase [Bryobacteraceae bacterium]|nr:zinc-binding alcohol dehydrogenase [Bryobacteraceae bacterium]
MPKIHGKLARLHGPRELCFEDISVDSDELLPDAVCAVTAYSAISIGTEKAAYIGLTPLRSAPAYPRLLGYCNSARVVGVGSDVRSVAPGDIILTNQSHQSCFTCSSSEILAKVPEKLNARAASLAYIAYFGLNALQRADLQAGECVAVQGLGPIGLATVAVARALGAGRIVALGNSPSRLETAIAFGADEAIDTRELEQMAGLGAELRNYADVVVTTVNAWAAWRTSLAIVREFGRVAVLGFPGRGEPLPTFNVLASDPFYVKQLSILSVGLPAGHGRWGQGDRMAYRRAGIELLLQLMASGELPLADLITHEVPWSELEAVYRRAESGDKTQVVAVLNWEASS